MELYEGGQYRIDIVGADSSIIVDSNTGKISASLANSTDTIVVDTEARHFIFTTTQKQEEKLELVELEIVDREDV